MASIGLTILFTSAALLVFLVGATLTFISCMVAFVEGRAYAGVVTLLLGLMAIGFSFWLWSL